jgi:hypothetical protein
MPWSIAIALIGAPAETRATTGCPLKKTSDGFVALRKGASQTAPIVALLNSRDMVLISREHERSGEWVYELGR